MEKIDIRQSWNSMTTPKVMERMETLYETNKWHDCVFKLFKSDGSGEELVCAHRLILASSSPVFEALFYGPLAEEGPISVPDVDPFAFRTLIKFIYTDTVDFNSVETACNVLYAAKKYLIYTLDGRAISYISDHIDESNCLQIHEFSKFVHVERLIKESWKYICSHLDDVLKYFPEEYLSNDIIKSLVSEEALNGGELVVFKMCELWAEIQCKHRNFEVTGENLRKVLIEMDILNKIRWLTLTQDEFEDEPVNSGILNEDEIVFIRKTIGDINLLKKMCDISVKDLEENHLMSLEKSNRTGTPLGDLQKSLNDTSFFPSSISNNIVARKKIQLKRLYCNRFIERETRPVVGLKCGLKICTLVTANKSIRLTGIFLPTKILPIPQLNTIYSHTRVIESNYEEKLIVTMFDCNNKMLFSILFSETVKYGSVLKIPLRNPVILERLLEYTIQVDLLNSVENYIFGVRNSVSTFPSGLCVTFKDQASMSDHGRCVKANDLSIISALELYL